MEFNFDYWANLYKVSPEEFERKRTAFIENEILNMPVEHRNNLRLLQWQCDYIRENNIPIESTMRISELMIEKLNQLKFELEKLKASAEDFNKSIK